MQEESTFGFNLKNFKNNGEIDRMDVRDFVIENDVLIKYVGIGESVVIPTGVREIKTGAFANYVDRIWEEDTRVKSVTFPETLEVIGDNAFYKNVALESVTFSTGLKKIGMRAFSCCYALKAIEIPEGVEWVETNAFSDCKGLRRIRIPNSIKTFNGGPYNPYSYENLVSLEEFVIETDPQNKEHIAFLSTRLFSLESLADYYINGKIKTCEPLDKALFKRLNTKTNRMRFFDKFNRIGNSFMAAKFLSLIPKMSVEELDGYIKNADGTPEIRSLFIEYKNRLYSAKDLSDMEAIQTEKALGMREKTLADWKKIYKINSNGEITGYKDTAPVAEVPAKVKNTFFNIGSAAFKYCDFLESVTIAEGITLIDNSAFNGCVKLASITIPSTLKKIGASAFKNCIALTNVYFPGDITNIGSKAFEGCENLVIHAPSGSKILKYAEKNKIPFVAE